MMRGRRLLATRSHRRDLIRGRVVAAVLAGWLIALMATASAASAAASRPNIVMLMTDDQTVADMQALTQTRALLSAHGTSFANDFASYPLCCPSRTTLLTGQYAHNHRVMGNLPPTGGYGALRGTNNTLPVWLERAGYYTAHIGKYLNGYGRDAPATVPPGWNEWYGSVDPSTYLMWGYTLNENGILHTYGTPTSEDPRLYQTDVYGRKAVDFIRRRTHSKRPFYLDVAFLAPHSEAGHEVLTTAPTVRSAPRDRGRFSTLPLPRNPAFNEADVSDKPRWFQQTFPSMNSAAVAFTTNSFRSRRASLLAVDDAVAAIVRALRAGGKLRNTLIVFTSDNGFFNGEHRITFGKYFVYEPAARVPLILSGPGVRQHATSRELVENTDLAATIVDAARARPGRALDGRSLLPFAHDPRRTTKRAILLESTVTNPGGDVAPDPTPYEILAPKVPRYAAIRTTRYVFIRYDDGERELYDLAKDPFQLRNRDGEKAYARTEAVLAHRLTSLARCRGRGCTKPESPVPGPARS